MATLARHVLEQGDNLRAIACILTQNLGRRAQGQDPETPGLIRTLHIDAPKTSLVNDYIAHVGGNVAAYERTLPSHMFPQWTFAHILRSLNGGSIDVFRALNGGCTLTTNALLPRDTPLVLTTQLTGIERTERKTVLHVRATMGPQREPESVVAEVQLIVPGQGKHVGGIKKEPTRVPSDATRLREETLSSHAGLAFAALTGDFNPIHWVPWYPRLFGHKNVILHGFSGMARVAEALIAERGRGEPERLRQLTVRFTSPVVLPTRVAVFARERDVWLAHGTQERAHLTGHFEMRD